MKFLYGIYDKVGDIIDIEIIFMLLKKKKYWWDICFKIFLKIWVNVWREKK